MSTSDFPPDRQHLDQFLYPYKLSADDLSPGQMIMDANLQEFSQRVAIICALESNGKLSPMDAYKEIKALWKTIETAKKHMLDSDLPSS